MYSPLKSNSQANKDSEKQYFQEQKNLKLQILLINKFRNKFKVVTSQEPEIDRLIIHEIQKLLSEGKNNENNLKQLDQLLNLEVTKMREQQKTKISNSQQEVKTNQDPIKARAQNKVQTPMEEYGKKGAVIDTLFDSSLNPDKFASSKNIQKRNNENNFFQSDLNQKAKNSSVVINKNPVDNNMIVYEDPADALNISDDKWNQIVQQNLKNFHEEKQNAKQAKYLKNKAIQEEQKKQIEQLKKLNYEKRNQEKEIFNTVGIQASNIYYINQDKRKERESNLKQSGKNIASDIRTIQENKQLQKQKQMLEDEQERQKIIELLRQEEIKEKEKKSLKKQELRKIMDQDWHEKKIYKEKSSAEKQKNTDFEDNNILSYVYTTKDHKAYEYDKKKEQMISLIVNSKQFGSPLNLHQKEMSIYLKDKERINKKNEEVQLNRQIERKNKEMETKIFQDQQILQKKALLEISKNQKQNDFSKMEREFKEFKQQEEQMKREKLQKNKNHLELVVKQMQQKPNMFAKTGVAILKNQNQEYQL